MEETQSFNEFLIPFVFSGDTYQASARFEKVQSIISVNLLLPEIDTPRMEICSCYVIAAYTACITLTNHLLERYCKELLTVFDFGDVLWQNVFLTDGTPKPDLSRYINKDLSTTLKACKTKGLLSKEDWKLFDKYKEIFRNGFSHYDPSKILQEATFMF